jgi:hypothetical protein
MNRLDDGIDVLGLVKGSHRWIILHTDAQRTEVLRQLQRWIDNDSLDFSVYDAQRFLLKMRQNLDYKCAGK